MLVACGPDQTVGEGSPVEGTGVGTAASGVYFVETLTTACSGKCDLVLGDIDVSVCDVGERTEFEAEVRQDDGDLRIDTEESDYIGRLDGRIDADGGFDVQGLRTTDAGAVTFTFRAIGVIDDPEGAATIAGTANGRIAASFNGETLSCVVTVEVEGGRNRALPEPGTE